MKLLKKTKKGFTLVELIVVIAIIAILAAVSVVSYIAFINKANESADQQAVSQMNKILMADSILNQDSNIYDLYDVLQKNGLSAKDYKPLLNDRYFFWDRKENRIVYTDKEYKVLYPENLANATKANGWYSLTNEITKKEYTVGSTTIEEKQYKDIVVTEAEQFTKIADDIKNGKDNGNFPYDYVLGSKNDTENAVARGLVGNKNNYANVHIKLDADEIDLMGGKFNFSAKWANIIIEGKEGSGTTIKNIVNGDNFGQSRNKEGGISRYGSGLLGYTYDCNVTFKNINVEDCYFGTDKYDLVGCGLIGVFNAETMDSTLEFENVTLNHNFAIGSHGTGSFAGKVSCTAGNVDVKFSGTNKAENCINKTWEVDKNGFNYKFSAGALAEIQPASYKRNDEVFYPTITVSADISTLQVLNNTSTNADGKQGAVYFAARRNKNSQKIEEKVNSLGNNNKFVFALNKDLVEASIAE